MACPGSTVVEHSTYNKKSRVLFLPLVPGANVIKHFTAVIYNSKMFYNIGLIYKCS